MLQCSSVHNVHDTFVRSDAFFDNVDSVNNVTLQLTSLFANFSVIIFCRGKILLPKVQNSIVSSTFAQSLLNLKPTEESFGTQSM